MNGDSNLVVTLVDRLVTRVSQDSTSIFAWGAITDLALSCSYLTAPVPPPTNLNLTKLLSLRAPPSWAYALLALDLLPKPYFNYWKSCPSRTAQFTIIQYMYFIQNSMCLNFWPIAARHIGPVSIYQEVLHQTVQ